MSRFIRLCVSAALATLVLLFMRPALSQTQASVFTASIDYSGISPALTQNPPAQLRLPSILASTSPLPVDVYYGTGGVTSNRRGELTGYGVYVQRDPQSCRQAISCTEAYAEATAIDGASPSIQEQYSLFYDPVQMQHFRSTAGHAPFSHQLSNGQTVIMLPWTEAGAGMGYEKAIWNECDANNICYRYVIALKGGDPNALAAMLESIPSGSSKWPSASGSGGVVSGDWGQLVTPVDPAGR